MATPHNLHLPKWDAQADVVVVGFGAAGAATAITAHDAGADVLILEKAPRGREGGNTRVSVQGYLNPSSIEKTVAYFNAMCGVYAVPQAIIKACAEELCRNNDWVRSIGGDPQEHRHQPEGIEFPELPGSDCVHKFHHGPVLGHEGTWKLFERAVNERHIEILYEAPGRELVQDHSSKEIVGVRAERGAKSIYVKARKAVVLTCGGFENNQEMIRDYLPGLPYCYTAGTPYNEGDGLRMAMAVGADLWHMNNFAGPNMALKVPEFPAIFYMRPLGPTGELPGGMIVVGPDAKRFVDEKRRIRHGKVKISGNWMHLRPPCPMFMVFDHTLFSSGPLYNKEAISGWNAIVERYDWSDDNSVELAKGWIKSAEHMATLAGMIGQDPHELEKTIDRWNEMCSLGEDLDFGRTKMLAPIRNAPFYAVELSPSMVNTQGGPRRNAKGQIIRPDGTVVPRLYSAGELGSIFSNLYQGTSNIAECMAFGRISGRNAAAEVPWE